MEGASETYVSQYVPAGLVCSQQAVDGIKFSNAVLIWFPKLNVTGWKARNCL